MSVFCFLKNNLYIAIKIGVYKMFMAQVKKKMVCTYKLGEDMLWQYVRFNFFWFNSYWLGELSISHVPSHISLKYMLFTCVEKML